MSGNKLNALLSLSVAALAGCAAEPEGIAPVQEEEGAALEPEGLVGPAWPDHDRELARKAATRISPQPPAPAPAGSTIAAAIVGNLGSAMGSPVATGVTTGFSSTFQPTCAYSTNAPDAVYLWTAPSTAVYVFTTTTSAFDTILEVRSVNTPFTSLGCNDDWGGTLSSAVTVSLTAGQQVYVNIDGYGAASGYYALNIGYKYPTAGWTPWLNRDAPSGVGDYENLVHFANAGQACLNPTAVQCQTLGGVDWTATGEVTTCNTAHGFYCVNTDQPDGACLDYRVRFNCP